MSGDGDVIVDICGHRWKIVSNNQTHSSDVYKVRDVIECNGNRPWIATSD